MTIAKWDLPFLNRLSIVMIFVSGEQNIGFQRMIFSSLTSWPIVIPSFDKSSPISDLINKTPIMSPFFMTGSLENPSFDSF